MSGEAESEGFRRLAEESRARSAAVQALRAAGGSQVPDDLEPDAEQHPAESPEAFFARTARE